MPDHTVAKASPSDLPAFATCQFRAFAHGPLHALIYATSTDAEEQHKKAMVEDRDVSVFLRATTDSTRAIVGGMKWSFYRSGYHDTTGTAGKIASRSPTENSTYKQDVLSAIFYRRAKMVNGPHVLIDLLFTDPGHRRRGIASQLIHLVCDEADRMSVTTIVEASPAGRRMYEKHGFVIHEYSTLELEQWPDKPLLPQYFMVRKPKIDSVRHDANVYVRNNVQSDGAKMEI